MTGRHDTSPPSSTSSTDSGVASADNALEERLRAALAPNLLLVRTIGSGGMARVFLAREPALKRLVAVKVLAGELCFIEEARARFEREAQAVASLSHPNIVAVHGVGELSDGTPYFVMQHVSGRSMDERVAAEGALPVAEARRALAEVSSALAAAHQQGIIHRDIKPSNILYEDATGRSLVSDFGISALAPKAQAQSARLTQTGVLVGTPMYMSPEQLLAEPVSEKTDIYSLGLLAHELLAGSGPFQGTTPNELIAAHLRDTPSRLSHRRPDVDAELDEIVARCLEKDAARRPTAEEVARRLAPGGAALLEWPPPGLEVLQGKLRDAATSLWLGSALILATMLAFILSGTRIASAFISPVALLLLLASMAGVLALTLGVRRTLHIGALTVIGRRSGYAWLTVLETLSDTKGDSGNLVAGSREYAALTTAQRSEFRRGRIVRELLLFVSGFLAVPLLVLVIILGSAGVAGPLAVWIPIVVSLLAVGVAFILDIRERRTFAAQRRRQTRARKADTSTLSGPWNESFDAVQRDQRLGRGSVAAPSAGRVVSVAIAALMVLMLFSVVPLVLVGTLGASLWPMMLPKFANSGQKAEIAEATRPYALPTDRSTTPMDAGRAFYALNPKHYATGFEELPPPTTALPDPPWTAPMPEGLFPTARPDAAVGLPSMMTIIEAARRGFSPAERAYLRSIATAPHWRQFATLARASRIDWVGARFVTPFADSAPGPWSFPIPRFAATKQYGYAAISRAAYHLEAGRRDSAEAVMREVVSFGFVMLDGGNTLLEQLIGAVMIGIGRHGLIQFYNVTADPRGALLKARTDAVIAAIDTRSDDPSPVGGTYVDSGDPASARAAVLRTLHDTTAMRGLRAEMLYLLGMTSCTNVRELVFGPAADVRESFDYARKRWALSKSDTAMIDLTATGLHRLEGVMPSSGRGRALTTAARVAGAVLGNPRLGGCTAMFFMGE